MAINHSKGYLMKYSTLLLPILLSASLLAGCSNDIDPIHNVNESISIPRTPQQVKKAILIAGAKRGWQMTAPQNGLILATFRSPDTTLRSRDYVANIKILYSANYYTIEYINSENLEADDGYIHQDYNHWIAHLDQDIQDQLNLADQL